jgi:Ca-activated chloride channel homolog
MNPARSKIAILAVSLVILLAANHRYKWLHWTNFLEPTSAQAQDSSKSDRPPIKRKVLTPNNPDEQDKPIKGDTSISVSVDLVSLQVLVTDKKGNIISGLKPENFTIYEDNVKQEIANFAPIEGNMTIVALFENSKILTFELMQEVRNAMYTFIHTLRKDDWIALVGFDLKTEILCDFTKDQNKIWQALKVLEYPRFSESNLSDAIIDTLDRTQEIEGKAAILLIGTGLDTLSKHTYDEALKKCKEANASIYAISLGQNVRLRKEAYGEVSPIQSLEFAMADNRLKSFAEFTGGEAFFPRFTSEYPSIFANISRLLRNQYSISYTSSNTVKDGKFRKIRVEVKTDLMEKGKPMKINVVTRKGYIAAEY